VQFSSKNDAAQAVQGAHGQLFAGRRIAVNFAAKKNTVERPAAEPSSTLFVGNLAYDITDKELNALFRPLRNIRDVRVAIDRRTGQPRGFAHADFTDPESAAEAKAHLDGKDIRGRSLKVDYSASNRNRFTPSQSESQPEE
jgi:nucleolin